MIPKYTFNYQRDTYVLTSSSPPVFSPLPYPSSSRPSISHYKDVKGVTDAQLPSLIELFGKNAFNIPIPSFMTLFVEHATAPFFVFQIFCVALWCLDDYWYYSLFTLFMLVVFECTVVWQVRRHNPHRRCFYELVVSSVLEHYKNSGRCLWSPTRYNALVTGNGKLFRLTT